MPRPKQPDLYVARKSFWCELDGVPTCINEGERVRAGHVLLRTQGEHFEPADTHVTYDVEQATAAPGSGVAAERSKYQFNPQCSCRWCEKGGVNPQPGAPDTLGFDEPHLPPSTSPFRGR
jgi:hypothetical protein